MDQKEYVLPRDSGYRIVRRLGSGGEGTVYLVCHMSTEQLRAAKILTNVREDRRHELDMMKHLNHPSLPKVIDVLEQDGYLWLIMEYIQGNRLDQSVSQGMARSRLWSIASQLSQVLVYLHSRKEPIYHLDIKPSNILIRPDQTLVLIDFGASIRGHPQAEKAGKYGTRGFAAPEQQKRNGIVDARADIYGVGAVLYYCCYGRVPVKGHLLESMAWQRLHHWRLACIINKCLENNPEKRYQDSRQLYTAICKAQGAEQFYQKVRRTASAMMLLLPVTVLFFYSLSGQSENSLEADAEPVSEAIVEEITEGFAEYSSEGLMEKETGSVLISKSVSETGNNEAENETENETDKEEELREQEYHRLLNMAGGMGFSQAVECYKQAAELCPGDGEWFLQLLEQVTVDGLFETEEENVIKELIYAVPSDYGDTALELLAADANAYGMFAYRMGLAYWYYYDGTGGKSAAAWWFQLALSSQGEETSAEWFGNAVILSRIGSYYGMLGSTNVEKERDEKEWDYWNDLNELWYLYQEQEEREEIRAQTAEEILSLLVLKSSVLYEFGASFDEMTGMISTIEAFLAEDIMSEDQKECEKLTKQSVAARAALERAYQE